MTTLDPKLLQASEIASSRLGLPARFLASWFVAENGWTCNPDYNFGNISYQGNGVPTGGVFEGVTDVQPNKVCTYESLEAGINAFILLVETPKSDKALSIDLTDLKACGDDIHKLCTLVGESNWAESHYDSNGEGAGSLIWDVYNSSSMADAFSKVSTPQAEVTGVTVKGRQVHIVAKGETLSRIALNFRVPLGALERLNKITNGNDIQIGEKIEIPLEYTVKPGDALSKVAPKLGTTVGQIATVSGINPNVIYPSDKLFY